MKSIFKKIALTLALAIGLSTLVVPFAACNNDNDGGNETVEEFTYKGKTREADDTYLNEPCDVYWINAAKQNPDDYTKIIGFKLKVKYKDAGYYGGMADTKDCPMGMLLLTKGAHEPDEYGFKYPGNYPVYDLSNKDICTFATGKAGETYAVTTAFNKGIEVAASVDSTVTLQYQTDNKALFKQGDPIMTAVYFLGDYNLISVEWILGDPVPDEEEPWDKVNVIEHLNVSTLTGKEYSKEQAYDGKNLKKEIESGNLNNYVDIYLPDTNQDSYPVILWIHGGGYITNMRNDIALTNNKDYLLAQGYAFVCVEYKTTVVLETDPKTGVATKYGEGGMPEMLHNIKTAVRFLRANAAKYKLNTDFIAAMGESAGAGLALLMNVTNGIEKPGDDFKKIVDETIYNRLPTFEDKSQYWSDQSSEVQAAIAVCAPTVFNGSEVVNMYALFGNEFNSNSSDANYYEALAEMYTITNLVAFNAKNIAPIYLANSKEDEIVAFSKHAKPMEDAINSFLSENDNKIEFYDKGGHVDKSVFDAYSSYVSIAKWVNTQRDKVLNDN